MSHEEYNHQSIQHLPACIDNLLTWVQKGRTFHLALFLRIPSPQIFYQQIVTSYHYSTTLSIPKMCLHSIDVYACGCKKSGPVLKRYCAGHSRYLDDVYDDNRRAYPYGRKDPIQKCHHLPYIQYDVNGQCQSHRRQTELDREIATLEKEIGRLKKLIVKEEKEIGKTCGYGKDRRGRREHSPY